MLPRVSATLALVLLALPAFAARPATWEEARKEAVQTGRFLVVDFYADWCGPCKRFDAAMLEDAGLKAAIEAVVLYQTDAEKEGKELAEEHKVTGYPTYVVFDAKGDVLGRWWGYEDPAQWVATLEGIQQDPTTMEQKQSRHAASPNAADARLLARYHHTRAEYGESIGLFEQAIQLDPTQEADDRMEIFAVAVDAHREDAMPFDLLRDRADAALAQGEAVSGESMVSVATDMVRAARREDDLSLARPYLVAAFERLQGDESPAALRGRERLAIDHALVVEQDATKAVALQKARQDDGWLQDADAMNRFAWWCFQNRINLEEAEAIARAAVDLAQTDGDKASVLDTVAEICNARGDCRDALSLAEQAFALDPDSEYLRGQVEKFQEILAAAQ